MENAPEPMADGQAIEPKSSENNIALLLACDDGYAPALAVVVESIAAHADPAKCYDILVFHTAVSERNRQKIGRQTHGCPHLSVRFINVRPWLEPHKAKLAVHEYFSIETYFRLFAPGILSRYRKVLWLDCDTLALEDIALLYETDLGERLVAGALSAGVISQIGSKTVIRRDWIKPRDEQTASDYLTRTLGLADPAREYINAGVLLMNLEAMRAERFTEACLAKLRDIPRPIFVDQDIINAVCRGRIRQLPLHWNVNLNCPICALEPPPLEEEQMQQFREALRAPKILHWTGAKPWNAPALERAEEWWACAKKTPFYEEILLAACRHAVRGELKALIKKSPDWLLKTLHRFKKRTKQKIASFLRQ